ncbi:MAG: HDOD domain-containing protein [Nitrospirae bacterium]|nr:HDOD domain-containing protein [Nitrospirota bacterium]
MKSILFVDDEVSAREELERTLRPMSEEWEVVYASSGREALAKLTKNSFDMAVVDMDMPGMSGAQLLTEIKTRHPQAIRILMADRCDQSLMRRSVVSAHQYLPKPFKLDLFKTMVTRAATLRERLASESLRQLADGIDSLPSLPALYRELQEELQSREPSIDKVARIISKDMGMVTKILQVINSHFFGLLTPVSNPAQAVSMLGLDRVKALVLSMQVFAQFKEYRHPFISLDVLWRHGLVIGAYARAIAKEEKTSQDLVDDAFTAGLLHDVGILVLATNLPDQYTQAVALMQNRRVTEWEAECEVLGASHADIGGYLLGTWGLSDAIVEAVAFHHDPMRSVSQPFSPLAAVHVANALEEREQAAVMGGGYTHIDEDYLAACGLGSRLPIWQSVCQEVARSRNSL